MERTNSEASVGARIAVALPAIQLRLCRRSSATTMASPTSAIATWERRSFPRSVAEDSCTWARIRSRRIAARRCVMPWTFWPPIIRNSTSFPTTPMSAWVLPSSCRFMDRPSTSPRSQTRSQSCPLRPGHAIESSPPPETMMRSVTMSTISNPVLSCLRLYLLAKPKSSYFVHRETLWKCVRRRPLRAPFAIFDATNVEIRQSSRHERKGDCRQVLQGSAATRPCPRSSFLAMRSAGFGIVLRKTRSPPFSCTP